MALNFAAINKVLQCTPETGDRKPLIDAIMFEPGSKWTENGRYACLPKHGLYCAKDESVEA